MEPQNLLAASTYINNLLLARGLLKSGRPIEFASPENEEGGTEATMARVINLVNDLVIRRDREAEHRENLATTVRTLRATESQQTLEIGKLKTKATELTRSLALADAQERAIKASFSSAESTIRTLKEQIQRVKATLTQVRAQCANDIRKRDLELQKLKSHLADRQRGKRDGLGVTTININPIAERSSRPRSVLGGEGLNCPGYSLKQETTEFLTELCQNLSDENDTLIVLARNTVQTLKDLQGLPQTDEEEGNPTICSSAGPQKPSNGPVTTLPASCEELSDQMSIVLEHLRTLLTNPSFVPLEEVEMRDEEIKSLREGWEKMESRWKQAVILMDGWHKRIANGGDSIQIDELQRGMDLDLHLSPNLVEATAEMTAEIETTAHPPIFSDETSGEPGNDRKDAETDEVSSSNEASKRSKERKTLKVPSRALKERNDNVRPARSPRKVSFTPGLQGSPCNPVSEEDETLLVKAHKSEAVTQRHGKKKADTQKPQDVQVSQQMSIFQKLAAVEDEARAAEQARKQSESRKRGRGAVKSTVRPAAGRRRSTLTHDELDELMGVPARSEEPASVFHGWVAHNATDPLKYTTFTPKPFTDSDIEIQVSHCGVCGTDVHTIRSGWGPTRYPCVCGHEIIGTVTRVGSSVTSSQEFRIGDRVGVGAQSMSCLRADCEACADGRENYCPRMTGTYNARYADSSKSPSYGGFATHWRGPAHFVFKIPDGLPSAQAAPLLCGGVTMFAPLRKYGAGPGISVGIVGVGGLGHMGILFAKAMGCARVVAISRTSGKRSDALEGLGADAFIATAEDANWAKANSRTLDLIICTVSSPDMPFAQYLRLLKLDGVFVQVGAPEEPLPALNAWSLIQKGVKVTGSSIGSPGEIRQMLQLAADKRVSPWVQVRPMHEVNDTLADMHHGKARYRYVLVNKEAQARL
ncbi:hypothetical protein ASPZODRAFT_92382 [Penicilliopsis zonata CBS 506.65]|uniref:alcohol dehydrogenase (NADP(+)) n=1 Tax=Penicilliopsis zonata CBS 506.65 TaxID=1073090 RepID=A0A1L9SLG9_9EURO|nr:hypothetical protein ASPZODRAFT_92382 [Penicilliopsis zonata CBS 506.65]OJJ48112.1 hypothetical protein ASPZODRAFT_92382 [Penicilliopsis zonata CBS 506.65]